MNDAPHSPAPASTARRSPQPPSETDAGRTVEAGAREPLDLATYRHARTRLGLCAVDALHWCRYYASGAHGQRDARDLSNAVGFTDDGRYYSLTGIDGTRYTTRAQAIEAQRRLDEAHGERLAARGGAA